MGQKVSSHKILVTGASGYIALHVIKQLLEDGHFVRGTVRNLKDEKKTAPIKRLASKNPAQLELVEAELSNADSWQAAVKDMQIVIHVASPFPAAEPEDEQSVIKPAVDGTLNVLRAAAAESKIKRVVVTSSGLAVFGYNWESKTYSEDDWPQADVQPSAYCKSKIIAERAAWDFVEDKKKKNEPCFELSVVNPVLVLGPILSEVYGTSSEWFLNVFQNKQDKVSNMSYPCCDVRDVATAHVRASFMPEAAGKRHLVITGRDFVPMKTWAEILSKEFKSMKIPTETEGEIIGKDTKCDDTRMRTVLGIKAIDIKTTLVDMANSFIQFGIVKTK